MIDKKIVDALNFITEECFLQGYLYSANLDKPRDQYSDEEEKEYQQAKRSARVYANLEDLD